MMDDFKLNRIPTFSADSTNAFSFYEVAYFVNSIISRVSHKLLYVYLLKSTLKNRPGKTENARNIRISSKVSQSRK